MLVAWRGTDTFSDAIVDMTIWKTKFTTNRNEMKKAWCTFFGRFTKICLVHKGFLEQYLCSDISARVNALVAKLLEEIGPEAQLHVTGHSLGGALANLSAFAELQMSTPRLYSAPHDGRAARRQPKLCQIAGSEAKRQSVSPAEWHGRRLADPDDVLSARRHPHLDTHEQRARPGGPAGLHAIPREAPAHPLLGRLLVDPGAQDALVHPKTRKVQVGEGVGGLSGCSAFAPAG